MEKLNELIAQVALQIMLMATIQFVFVTNLLWSSNNRFE